MSRKTRPHKIEDGDWVYVKGSPSPHPYQIHQVSRGANKPYYILCEGRFQTFSRSELIFVRGKQRDGVLSQY